MDETYNIKAIILKREPFREFDTRVSVYSREKGRLDLIARGTKRMKSKIAGHTEPITLADIMVVRGRQLDYIGSARNENAYARLKEDSEKVTAAGQAINIFNDLIKTGEADEEIFRLLQDFLHTLNREKKGNYSLWSDFFILKLLARLGYAPELYNCLVCMKKVLPQGNIFDPGKGGLICLPCSAGKRGRGLTIGENSIKVLRLVLDSDFDKLIKLKNLNIEKELQDIIGSFKQYRQ